MAPRFTVEAFWEDLQTSLRLLGTEYVDLYQFHNPDFCPRPLVAMKSLSRIPAKAAPSFSSLSE